MEPTEKPKPNEIDIPKKIFTQLIQELAEKDLPKSVIDQLTKTIVEGQDFSEKALRSALTPNPEI